MSYTTNRVERMNYLNEQFKNQRATGSSVEEAKAAEKVDAEAEAEKIHASNTEKINSTEKKLIEDEMMRTFGYKSPVDKIRHEKDRLYGDDLLKKIRSIKLEIDGIYGEISSKMKNINLLFENMCFNNYLLNMPNKPDLDFVELAESPFEIPDETRELFRKANIYTNTHIFMRGDIQNTIDGCKLKIENEYKNISDLMKRGTKLSFKLNYAVAENLICRGEELKEKNLYTAPLSEQELMEKLVFSANEEIVKPRRIYYDNGHLCDEHGQRIKSRAEIFDEVWKTGYYQKLFEEKNGAPSNITSNASANITSNAAEVSGNERAENKFIKIGENTPALVQQTDNFKVEDCIDDDMSKLLLNRMSDSMGDE